MLDVIRGFGGNGALTQKHADDLQALIVAAQQERTALSAMLTQVTMRGSKLTQMSRALETFEARSVGALNTLDEIDRRVAGLEEKCLRFADVDERVAALLDAAARARQTAQELIAPGSDLHHQREQVQALFGQLREMHGAVETLRSERSAIGDTLEKDRASVEALRTQLAQSTHDIRQSLQDAAAVRAEVEQVRSVTSELVGTYATMTVEARGLRESTTAAMDAFNRELTGTYAVMTDQARGLREHTAAAMDAVGRVESMIARLTAPGSDLDRYGAQAQELAGQLGTIEQAVESLRSEHLNVGEVLQRDRSSLEALRTQLAESMRDLTQSLKDAAAVRAEVDRVRSATQELTGTYAAMTDEAGVLRNATTSAMDAVRRVESIVGQLTAPGSDLHRYGTQVDDLSGELATMKQAVETLRIERLAVDQALQQDRASVEALRSQLAESTDEVKRATDAAAAVSAQVDEVRHTAHELTGNYAALSEDARGLRDSTTAAVASIRQVEATIQHMTSPGGELHRYRDQVQELFGQLRDMHHAIETLERDRASFEDLRAQLAESAREMTHALDTTAAVREEVDQIGGIARELAGQYAALDESKHDLEQQTAAAMTAVGQVESTAESLGSVRELAANTEERISALNALAEHVMLKLQSLDSQKHVVERAVLEANRLNEMVWNMDVQIDKLNDGLKQMARGEQASARIRKLVEETHTRADAAQQVKDELLRETARVERDGRALVNTLAAALEKLALQKNEFDAFDRRVGTLQTALADAEHRVAVLATREKDLSAMDRKTDALAIEFRLLTTQADALAAKQAGLDSLHARLREVDDLSRRTASQYEALQKSRFELDALRSEAAEFRRIHAEIADMRHDVAQDRSALEAFAERLSSFRAQTPELEAAMDFIVGRLGQVDEGFRKAAKIGEISAGLDAQLSVLGTRMQVVNHLESRLNALHALTNEVDRKVAEQLTRRTELEALKDRCDGVAAQVLDAQQKVDVVDSLRTTVAMLSDRIAQSQEQLDRLRERFADVKVDEAAITAQQARLTELAEQGRQLTAEVEARMAEVQALGAELASSNALKGELAASLATLETRQRDVALQTQIAEEQLVKADMACRSIDERQSQLAVSERKLAQVEDRIGDTIQKAGDIERRMKQLADREQALASIKADIADLQQITASNKADLQFILEHRQDIAAMRPQVEELLASAAEVQTRIAGIDARRKTIEEVQARTYTVLNLFEDVRLNVETIGAHKAIIDDVSKKLAGIGFAVQDAENTLKTLQRERELAQQVEERIKELR